MRGQQKDRAWLEAQADRIEKVLTSMDLPVRVSGGVIGEESVRYHLTPVGGTAGEGLARARRRMAEAIGVEDLQLTQGAHGYALAVPMEASRPLRLLPLLQAMEPLPANAAVLGMAESGRPMILRLDDPGTAHLLVWGQAEAGKSELLRTAALSACLGSRRSELRIVAIDVGGTELAVVQSAPHLLCELGANALQARDLIMWLSDVVSDRLVNGHKRPKILVLIDDLERIEPALTAPARSGLQGILARGGEVGVHLWCACRRPRPGWAEVWKGGGGVVEARPLSSKSGAGAGLFQFRRGRRRLAVQVAWLSASDLSAVAARLRRPGPGPGLIDLSQT